MIVFFFQCSDLLAIIGMITKNSFKTICSKTLSMNCISPSSNPAERALWLSSLFKMNAEKHLARGPIIGARKDGNRVLVAELYPLSSMTDGSQKTKTNPPGKQKQGDERYIWSQETVSKRRFKRTVPIAFLWCFSQSTALWQSVQKADADTAS